jgi:hypothetical protein
VHVQASECAPAQWRGLTRAEAQRTFTSAPVREKLRRQPLPRQQRKQTQAARSSDNRGGDDEAPVPDQTADSPSPPPPPPPPPPAAPALLSPERSPTPSAAGSAARAASAGGGGDGGGGRLSAGGSGGPAAHRAPASCVEYDELGDCVECAGAWPRCRLSSAAAASGRTRPIFIYRYYIGC